MVNISKMRTISIYIEHFPGDLEKLPESRVKVSDAWISLQKVFQALYNMNPKKAESILNGEPLGTHIIMNLPNGE